MKNKLVWVWIACAALSIPVSAHHSTAMFDMAHPITMKGTVTIEFLQTPGRVTLLYEYEHLVRRVYMDGRDHPRDLDPTAMGHSIGRWEGNTLVVETVGLADTTLLNTTGLPHSESLQVVERIRRILNGTVLEVEFTIDDPTAYTKSWKATSYWKRDPKAQIMEYNCDYVVDYRRLPGRQ